MSQKFRVRELKIKSAIANRSGLVTENMTSATPDKVVGTTFKAVLVNENGEQVVGSSVLADKSYSYSVNSGCQSYGYSLFSSGGNCVGQSGQTYILSPITCPSIPAPTQTAPSGYKRVCDIVLEGTNYNQTQQNTSVLKSLTINGIGGNLIGGTTWFGQSGQSPKNDTGVILGQNINQSSTTTVSLTILLCPDGMSGLSITNPDYRIQIKYHIRLALV